MQLAEHLPPEQTCDPVHTTPHAPQLLGSLVGTHWPLHALW
jgi:hypothetical protein